MAKGLIGACRVSGEINEETGQLVWSRLAGDAKPRLTPADPAPSSKKSSLAPTWSRASRSAKMPAMAPDVVRQLGCRISPPVRTGRTGGTSLIVPDYGAADTGRVRYHLLIRYQQVLPSVSVVVPVRNVARWLPLQLDALAHQTYEGSVEVLVVADPASTDGTMALVQAWAPSHPEFSVIVAPAKGGIGQARNLGIRQSTGDVILCCDGDDLADPGWVKGMVAAASTYDIFGGKLDYEVLGKAAVSRRELQADGLSVALSWQQFVCGVSLGMTRAVFDELGGFSEDYLRCEDLDFSWRAIARGFAIGFAPEARMSYRQRSDLRSSLFQSYTNATWYPRLYRDFRSQGMPGPSVPEALKKWGRLATTLPLCLRSPERRGRWLRVAAQTLGQTVGSVKYRVFWPV